MKITHTPGPWYLARTGYGSVVCATAATLLPLSGGVAHLDVVARTDWNRGDEDEANARLVAAAPDLLAALQDVLAHIENHDKWWMDDPTKGGFDTALIRAAIAKATG